MMFEVLPFRSPLSSVSDVKSYCEKINDYFAHHKVNLKVALDKLEQDHITDIEEVKKDSGCGTFCGCQAASSSTTHTPHKPSRDSLIGDRVLTVMACTGGVEAAVINHCKALDPKVLVIISHPDLNSLPASLEIAAHLSKTMTVHICHINSPTAKCANFGILKALSLRTELEKIKMGVIGKPSDWLVGAPDVEDPNVLNKIENIWGIKVVPMEFSTYHYLEKAKPSPKRARKTVAIEHKKELINEQSKDWQSEFRTSIPESEVEASVNASKQLVQLCQAEGLQSVTVRCFDMLKDSVTSCVALSELNDNGIVAGCEGDIPATIAMCIAKIVAEFDGVTPATSFMANPVDIGETTISLAHCTIPLAMCDKYVLRTHFESSSSVAIQGHLRELENATLFRVDATSDRIYCASGDVKNCDVSEQRCRTQATFHTTKESVSQLLAHPIGNHLILSPIALSGLLEAYLSLFAV